MRVMNNIFTITATLNELEFLMGTIYPPAFMALGDGMALADIERTVNAYSPVLDKAGVDFPSELIELYHWHNGSNGQDIIGPVQLLSLEEALETWRALIDAKDTEFPSDDWYYPSWIPFAKSWSDCYLCIDAKGVAGGNRGQIVEFDRNHPTRTIQALYMRDWFQCVVDDYSLEEYTRTHGIPAGEEGEDGLYDYDPEEPPEGPNCHINHFKAGA